MSGIDSVRGSSANGLSNGVAGGEDRASGAIPGPRSAADAYRVSDDEVHRARLVVAKNSKGSDDLRLLLDMLGLVSANPDLPPPVCR